MVFSESTNAEQRMREHREAMLAESKADREAFQRGKCPSCREPLHEPNDDCWWQDYASCPYFTGEGDKMCAFGCTDEPECHTCRPTGGWPSESGPS